MRALANVEVKAHRLARSDAVQITSRDRGVLRAKVQGDSDSYLVEITPAGSVCTCVASSVFHRLCSHIRALHLYESYGAIWQAERRAQDRQNLRED